MCTISIHIPEAVRQSTRMDTETTGAFARRSLALAYYHTLRQPIESCAEIAQMSVEAFGDLLQEDEAAHRLLAHLDAGYQSGEKQGWATTEQAMARREEVRKQLQRQSAL